jgi:outer membrane protein OmpA-like peptidoglycan-associated protein/Mg-chelatase subunit ChlD
MLTKRNISSTNTTTYKYLQLRYRVATVVISAVFIVSMAGCVHTVMEQVEKMLPPKGYKPRYIRSTMNMDSLARDYEKKYADGVGDTSQMYDDEQPYNPNLFSKTDSTQPKGESSEQSAITNRDSGSTAENDTTWNITGVRGDGTPILSKSKQKNVVDSVIKDGKIVYTVRPLKSTTPRGVTQESDTLSTKPAPPAQVETRSLSDELYPKKIEIRTTLYDSAGRFILGLAPPKFTGRGNYRNYWKTLVDSCSGKQTDIKDFDVELRSDLSDPYAVAFAIDQSGSMGDMRIRKLREAVRATMNIITQGDYLTVVPFAGQSVVEVSLDNDSASYKRKFSVDNKVKIKGGTSIYDASMLCVDELSKAPSQFKKAIILFTDGADVTSKKTLVEASQYARKYNIPIYTIAYGVTEEEPLMQLAQLTRGRFYKIYSVREFAYVFADIYRSLKLYYRITYTPPECSGIHSVKYTVSIPELGVKRLTGRGMYDRSLITVLDTIGAVTFLNVEFETGKAVIRGEESTKLIAQVAESMKNAPTIAIEVRGHTDNRGNEELNKHLSEQRANAVISMLVSMGIEKSRLTAKGFGSTQPLVDNSTEENRARNRRTEFVIVKNTSKK